MRFVAFALISQYAALVSGDGLLAQNIPDHQAPPSVSQTVVSNSFESVEMEKLRLAKEIGKISKDDADFEAAVLKLKKKLAEASFLAFLPTTVPSELRSFLNISGSEVDQTKAYYVQLSAVLNKLSPASPYNSGTTLDTVNPKAAADLLGKLASFEEDEGLSQTILNQWGAKVGGARDDARQMRQLNSRIYSLIKERKRLEWNHKMTLAVNPLSGEEGGTGLDRKQIQEQIDEVKSQIAKLESQKITHSGLTTIPLRQLEFQQFILQLAVQQRYLHALIACGFYRNVFSGGDMSIKQEARPTQGNSQPPGSSEATPATKNSSPAPNQELSTISTIPGLESFLLNRIRDAKADRKSLENMLATKQLGTAESLLAKMLLTAKYQPELHTLPLQDRQGVLKYSQTIRGISESIDAKNFPEILALCDTLSESCADTHVQDVKAFANENRKKALFWVKQAEIAGQMGDVRSAQLLLEVAQRRAPHDQDVEIAIAQLEEGAITGTKLKNELAEIIKRQDYQTAYTRMADFMPLTSTEGNEAQKAAFLDLMEKEKSVRMSIEKSESLEKIQAFPEAWLALENTATPLNRDPRIVEKKSHLMLECPDFSGAYIKGEKFEADSKIPLALVWYLEALSLTPGNANVKEKIRDLGEEFLAARAN